MKKILMVAAAAVVVGALAGSLAGCNDADVASHNLSTAADNFQIQRRIVFYNSWTNTNMLSIEGLCSLGNADHAGELSVTCKVGPGEYKKHFLGLNQNVSYFVEQMDGAMVSPYHYKVVFQPSQIIPDLEVK